MSRHYSSTLRILVVTALLAGVTRPVAAQGGFGRGSGGDQRMVQVVVSGGLTVAQGELKETHDNGFHADASLILHLPGLAIAVRPELSYTSLNLRRVIDSVNGVFADRKTQLLSGMGNIEVPLAAGVYLIGGIGAMRNNSEALVASVVAKQTAFVIDAGAGVRFNVGSAQGFLEARLGTASYDKSKFGYSRAQLIPLTFGFAF